jgi:glycyl-tRNA synthetase
LIDHLVTALRKAGISNRVDESSGSIGRRYARNDELGTPFAVTVDFDSLKDYSVTLRERDTTKQIREKIPVIVDIIKELVEERLTWADVMAKHPAFNQQQE